MRPSRDPRLKGAVLMGRHKVLVAVMALAPSLVQGQTVQCDRFQLEVTPRGTELAISLDTDLPDATVLMVSVSRSYWAGAPLEEYPLDYYESRSTVADWRHVRRVSVEDGIWRRKLDERLRLLAAAGEPTRPTRIDTLITVSFTVPINQPDPRFGPGNRNLVGARVATTGLRIVRSESKLSRPFAAAGGPAPARYGSPQDLKTGVTYALSRESPLTPERRPSDPVRAMALIRQLPAGTLISIVSVDRSDHDNPWYRVTATSRAGSELGTGWINSIALIGQEIRVVRP